MKVVNEVAEAKAKRKKRQAFYTPPELGALMVRVLDPGPDSCLEPSAGHGGLVHLLVEAGVQEIDACEIDPGAREALLAAGECRLVAEDFLTYRPDRNYRSILMNPPFNGKTYLEHLEHAWTLLADGGRIVTLAPISLLGPLATCSLKLPGCENAEAESLGSEWFKDFDTNIEVLMVTLDRSGPGLAREVCGFSNGATFNAAIMAENDRDLLRLADRCESGAALHSLLGRHLVDGGGSAYGVDWSEVLEHLKARKISEEEAAFNPEEAMPPPVVDETGQHLLFAGGNR